jgi:8-oxo-dGTP pyrophosphatase MutT (NUDIX family)
MHGEHFFNLLIIETILNSVQQNWERPLNLANLSQQHIFNRLQGIEQVSKSNSNPEGSLQSSAVLVPLLWRSQEWHLLLIRRSESVSSHKGQIAFPGGRWEEQDPSFLETALRETREELGEQISPVKILGALPTVSTHSTGYLIYPFVGVLKEPLVLEPDSWEVAEVLTLPLTGFLSPTILEPVSFDCGPVHVWGATARIIHQFIQYLREGEPS